MRKRYLLVAMAFNLGRVMRSLFGAGKPRHLAVLAERLRLLQILVQRLMAAWRSAHQVVTAMRRNKLTASVAVAAVSDYPFLNRLLDALAALQAT